MAATMHPRTAAVALVRWSSPPGSRPAELAELARDSGLHPDLVRRFMVLGLVERIGGTARSPVFAPDAASLLARAGRLRRDLGLNHAGAVFASELIARIDDLERRLDRYEPRRDRPR
jgi:hypothetical protein